jgi:predicted nucleic acid-binding protein
MSDKYFLDTNIFVYSFDQSQPEKMEKARAIIDDALQKSSGIISYQVIQEFINVATRKFAVPLKLKDVKEYLRLVLNPLCQVYPDLELYETSLDLQNETGYSFYDSLILSAALHGGCSVIYSEDLRSGQYVHSLRIVNPFDL